MSLWTTEITNNPEHDYALYMELLEDDEAKARIERNTAGELHLSVYPSNETTQIPAAWIRQLLIDAEKMI